MSAGSSLPPAQDVVESGLAAARAGSDDCVVIVEETSEVEVRLANNTTTTNGARRDRRLTVISLRQTGGGMAAGVARGRGDMDITELVRSAERDASGSPPAEDAAPLVDPAAAGVPSQSSRRFDRPPETTDLSVLSGVLSGLSGAFARARTSGRVLAGFAEHRQSTGYLGTSTGVRLGHAQPQGALHLVGRSDDGAGSSWVGVGTADFTDVSVEELETRVAGRLAWSSRQLELPAGRYEVILPPEGVSDLMVALAYELGGRDAEDGRNAFSRAGGGTRVGDRLTSTPFRLRSDPAEPGLECAPFVTAASSSADESVFDNGLPLSRTDWIASGRLERLRYHRAGAARAGVDPAGFVANLVLEADGADGTLEEMVSRTERGLLLTCLWYIREVDPTTMLLTGLTRDGVYVVEDGHVVGAANNFRFNESPVDLLDRATEVGSSVRALGREFGEYLNRTRMPAMRVPDFNMSTVSRAS
ncbi:MAG: metallopeptidase TldD-related protein [Acidimicrobiales bacterium]